MQIERKQTASIENRIIAELDALPDTIGSYFSELDDAMIRKYYPTKGSAIAKVLGKTAVQIRHRAEHLGIRKIRFKEGQHCACCYSKKFNKTKCPCGRGWVDDKKGGKK